MRDSHGLLERLGRRVPRALLLEALTGLEEVRLGRLHLAHRVEQDGGLAVLVAGVRELGLPPKRILYLRLGVLEQA